MSADTERALRVASENLDIARDEYMQALLSVWSYGDDVARNPSMLNRGTFQAASRNAQEKRVTFIAASSAQLERLEANLNLSPITVSAKEIQL